MSAPDQKHRNSAPGCIPASIVFPELKSRQFCLNPTRLLLPRPVLRLPSFVFANGNSHDRVTKLRSPEADSQQPFLFGSKAAMLADSIISNPSTAARFFKPSTLNVPDTGGMAAFLLKDGASKKIISGVAPGHYTFNTISLEDLFVALATLSKNGGKTIPGVDYEPSSMLSMNPHQQLFVETPDDSPIFELGSISKAAGLPDWRTIDPSNTPGFFKRDTGGMVAFVLKNGASMNIISGVAAGRCATYTNPLQVSSPELPPPLMNGVPIKLGEGRVAASAAAQSWAVYVLSSMVSKGANNNNSDTVDDHTPPVIPVSAPGSGSHAWLKFDGKVYTVADQPRALVSMDLGIKSGSFSCNDHFNASLALSLKYKKLFDLPETPSFSTDVIFKTGEGFAAGVVLGSAYHFAKGFLKPGSVQDKFLTARKAVGSNFLRAGFAGAAVMAAFSVLQSSPDS